MPGNRLAAMPTAPTGIPTPATILPAPYYRPSRASGNDGLYMQLACRQPAIPPCAAGLYSL